MRRASIRSAHLLLTGSLVFWSRRAFAAYDPETDGWKLGIGDASAFGYASVILYGVAALMLLRNGSRHPGDRFGRSAGVGMIALAVNKALDLQTAVADWGKHIALEGEWYGGRRSVQIVFIALGVCVGVWALVRLPKRLGTTWPAYRLCALAAVMLVVFVLVRASSLHQLGFLSDDIGGLRIGTAIEIALLLIVIGGARNASASGSLG